MRRFPSKPVSRRNLFALTLMSCFLQCAVAQPGTLVFRDEFDTEALFIEHFKPDSIANWKVEEGSLTTERGGGIRANAPLEPACKVGVDVALRPNPEQEGGFAGVTIGGCNFFLRPDGFWCTYPTKGEERLRGSFSKAEIEPERLYHFEITRHPMDGGFAYSWTVDGKQMAEFIQMNPKEDEDASRLGLQAWRLGARFDNVAVYNVEAGSVSSNTLRNSSFEFVQDGLPIYWTAGVGVDNSLLRNYRNHETYWKTVRLDPENPRSGKQSLRIEANAQVPMNGFKSFDADINKSAPFTYSVWLKADREDVAAELILHEKWGRRHARKITVGTQWEKYSFTLPESEKGQIWAGFQFNTPAVVWADDAQLEAGEATGDYQPSAADARIGKAGKEEPVQSYAVPLANAPSLDGRIGKEWDNALVLDDFRIVDSDKSPQQRTTARLLSDRENLYIAFSCFEKEMKALVAGDENVLGKISAGDCVEVFLDISGEKKNFYHLFVNPDGGRLLADPKLRMGWNEAWEVKTSKHADHWEVEIRIPFNSLEDAQAQWGINLARHEPRAKDNSCTARVGPKFFSDVARYDEFTFPAGSALGMTPAGVAKAIREKPLYPGRNFYMNETEATVIASNIPADGAASLVVKTEEGKTVHSKTAPIKAGKNRFTIPLNELKEGTYRAELKAGDKVIGSTPLVKRPFQENAVQLDLERLSFLVEGTPYFVFAPFMVSNTTETPANVKANIDYLANAGMKSIAFLIGLKGDAEKNETFVRQLLDECSRRGIKALLWIKETPELDPVVAHVKTHSALLAWMLWDEPELYAKEDEVAASNERFRKLEPYHPLIMNNTIMGIPSRYAGLNTDIISHDDYITNKPDRKVAEILDNLTNLDEASRELRKPALAFISGVNLQNHYRETSAGEIVAQSYGAVIGGMAGTWYFFGIPIGKESWAAYQRTNRELLSLNDVLFSTEERPVIASSRKSVITTTRRHEGKIYLITTNIEAKPVTAGFQLPEGAGEVEVLFENRKIEVKNGVIEDRYEPHARHVYRFDAQD